MPLDIKFSSHYKGYIKDPIPTKLKIPDAYKKMPGFYNGEILKPTLKKCMPFLDTLTFGYLITTSIEYILTKKEGEYVFSVSDKIPKEHLPDFDMSNHPDFQMSEQLRNKHRTIDKIFKFRNPWTIKTPPGYSCLFTQPFNRNSDIAIIDGIVDTDSYHIPVEFPFFWTGETSNDVLLQEDTIVAQVIPFKRDTWRMQVSDKIDNDSRKWISYFPKFWDNYKTKFWHKKDFR